MIRGAHRPILAAAAVLAVLAHSPAGADVRAGIDAWGRGDHAAAVRAWQGPAALGDADAMFNLAQAYRLGRGVPEDLAKAEALYERAAAAGHLQAADAYGLLLFQNGHRATALPFIVNAARRGDPRAEYLLGIAYFNGDGVPKDWTRAYALMMLANNQGLPHAVPALAQMERHIPSAQRQQGAQLAVKLGRVTAGSTGETATTTRSRAALDGPLPGAVAILSPTPDGTAISSRVTAAHAGVGNAAADTAADGDAHSPAAAFSPAVRADAPDAPARDVPSRKAATGSWRVQLGVFAVHGNAERLWARLSERGELSGKTRLVVPMGKLTKLQATGYASRASAEAACRSLQSAGQECLVTR